MARNDNPQARRLMESMERHGRKEEAEMFSSTHPLPASAKPDRKFGWAKDVCAFLDGNYDASEVMDIRMDCACGPTKGMISKIKPLYDRDDPSAFVENVNGLDLGYTLEYDGDSFYLIYPECYCSCVNKTEETLPVSWCYCTLGYSKRWFGSVFEREVRVELIKAIKAGDDCCRIRITIV